MPQACFVAQIGLSECEVFSKPEGFILCVAVLIVSHPFVPQFGPLGPLLHVQVFHDTDQDADYLPEVRGDLAAHATMFCRYVLMSFDGQTTRLQEDVATNILNKHIKTILVSACALCN